MLEMHNIYPCFLSQQPFPPTIVICTQKLDERLAFKFNLKIYFFSNLPFFLSKDLDYSESTKKV